jgi:hypothetical protein
MGREGGKILCRRNKPKTLLKRKELAFLGFKTNCISGAKNVNQSEKYGQKSTLCEALNQTGK